MLGYGIYAAGWSLVDLLIRARLEAWADMTTAATALLLVPAAVLIRAGIPGGLPLGLAALLGLQAISLHNSMHLYGEIQVWTEAGRAAFGAVVMLVAAAGQRDERRRTARDDGDDGDKDEGTR